jgi:hypothetical protein
LKTRKIHICTLLIKDVLTIFLKNFQALDGFVFVIGEDGQFLFISDNVSQYLGLLPVSKTM